MEIEIATDQEDMNNVLLPLSEKNVFDRGVEVRSNINMKAKVTA